MNNIPLRGEFFIDITISDFIRDRNLTTIPCVKFLLDNVHTRHSRECLVMLYERLDMSLVFDEYLSNHYPNIKMYANRNHKTPRFDRSLYMVGRLHVEYRFKTRSDMNRCKIAHAKEYERFRTNYLFSKLWKY